jgi:hypothetical protein
VKAGSTEHYQVDLNTTLKELIAFIRERMKAFGSGAIPFLAFFPDMERMLSDQAFMQGRLGDALAHTGDEGRSTLR